MTVIIDNSTGEPIPTFDIMVDYDDVVQPWAQVVHEKCRELGLHDLPTWSSWSMWEDYGCDQERWLDAVLAAQADGLYTNVDPFPTALQGLARLFWSGHRIHIVTARGFMAHAEDIRRWTRDHIERYAVPHHSLTFSKNKAESMAEMGLHFDFAIDDSTKNYDILDAAGVEVYLATQPHNVADDRPRRVDDLWHFSNVVLNRQAVKQREIIARQKEGK